MCIRDSCLIVKDDKIISIGQTGYNGRPHAEFNAIINSFQDLSEAKMYVTLEPCNHYGKTPPCTKSIIRSGIKEVIYSINDIDSKVKGKSFNPYNRDYGIDLRLLSGYNTNTSGASGSFFPVVVSVERGNDVGDENTFNKMRLAEIRQIIREPRKN